MFNRSFEVHGHRGARLAADLGQLLEGELPLGQFFAGSLFFIGLSMAIMPFFVEYIST